MLNSNLIFQPATLHENKFSTGKRFEIRVAESSQKALKLLKKSSLEIAKVGTVSTKQKIVFSKFFGLTETGSNIKLV